MRPLTACRRTVSGTFHPPPGVLFTFPSRYSCTIGRQEYLALEGGPPGFPRDSTGPAVLKHKRLAGSRFAYGALTPYGAASQRLRLTSAGLRGWLVGHPGWASNPASATATTLARTRFGLVPVRSPLLGESRLISTPRGTKMFQFPRFPPTTYGFSRGCVGMTPRALPHSGILGSAPADGSPRLVAVDHALRRLLAPRHPPYALCCAARATSRTRHTPDLALFST